MNYEEAIDWLYTHLPMYQRIGAAAYKEDLTNTIKLCNYFDNPQNNFKSIHIAGTNGKGSTSHMIAAVLQGSGYKVGLYTSPHLKSFTERIRINGKEIEQIFVTDFVSKNKDYFATFDPSFFEITVAMAFEYFKNEKVDIAVIETGLGGRLDSTNIITPILSVITNIGLDHQNLLGETLEKIAGEKAGIIKKGVPVIVGQYQSEVADVFRKRAVEMESGIIFADDVWQTKGQVQMVLDDRMYQKWSYQNSNDKEFELITDQLGIYQEHNCKTSLVALQQLEEIGFKKVSKTSIESGYRNVANLTGLKGRWQILGEKPKIIADTGHNIDGIKQIVKQFETEQFETLRMVIGFVNDKNIDDVLQILPRNAKYYFTQASIPRALPANELMKLANLVGLDGLDFDNCSKALAAAKNDSKQDDLIFIGGSTFVVAELI